MIDNYKDEIESIAVREGAGVVEADYFPWLELHSFGVFLALQSRTSSVKQQVLSIEC